MNVGEINMKEIILITRTTYSVLKEEIEEH
jgi:hypothetical protein